MHMHAVIKTDTYAHEALLRKRAKQTEIQGVVFNKSASGQFVSGPLTAEQHDMLLTQHVVQTIVTGVATPATEPVGDEPVVVETVSGEEETSSVPVEEPTTEEPAVVEETPEAPAETASEETPAEEPVVETPDAPKPKIKGKNR